jgi:alkylation response protein AidB-like acyl-CoA dehydrogenase
MVCIIESNYPNRSEGTVVANIAKSRAEIDAARLLVLNAALMIDKHTAKGALKEIGIAKACTVFVGRVKRSD